MLKKKISLFKAMAQTSYDNNSKDSIVAMLYDKFSTNSKLYLMEFQNDINNEDNNSGLFNIRPNIDTYRDNLNSNEINNNIYNDNNLNDANNNDNMLNNNNNLNNNDNILDNNQAYNNQSVRKTMIERATEDTFGFDCVCLVKGILWGWNADVRHVYGGATYQSNGVPDTTITNLLKKYCTEQSTDFSKIEVGEFLTMGGHCGVYIGDGLAIECTPKWKNGVQISEVWNIKKTSSVGRTWVSHGKLKVVEYIKEEPKPDTVKCDVFCVFPENATDAEINSMRVEMGRIGVRPAILTKRG